MKYFLIFIILYSTHTFSCDKDGKSGIMPKNSMRIPVDAKIQNGMTEIKFKAILKKIENVYKPVVKARKRRLKIIKKWKDDTVNANAAQVRKTYKITVYGGLARHPLTTEDSLLLVICHEMGHHLGGAPRKGISEKYWASSEGQADYWASMKCMRRVLLGEDNQKIISQMEIEPIVREKCESIFQDSNERALCMRSSMASLSLSKLLADGDEVVSFLTPDQNVVVRTSTLHPEAQCRLDTYFQGALCERDYLVDVDYNDPTIGVCLRSDYLELGPRPLCWYHP